MCFLSLKILHRTLPHLSHFLAFAAFLASLSSSVNLHSFWCFLIEDILKLDPQFEQRTCLFSPCIFFMWVLKKELFIQEEQRLHRAFSFSFPTSLWLLVWFFRTYLLLKHFEQNDVNLCYGEPNGSNAIWYSFHKLFSLLFFVIHVIVLPGLSIRWWI